MLKTAFAPVLAIIMASSSFQALAQEPTEQVQIAPHLTSRADDIVAVMKEEKPYGDVFADVFVQAVPEASFRQLTAQITSQFGAVVGVESLSPGPVPNSANIEIRMERGIAIGVFQTDAEAPYKVPGFRLTEFKPLEDAPQAILDDLQSLPGDTALYLAALDAPDPVIAYNADQPLAIGSTFKLYVLSALAHSIVVGEHSWSDVVQLGNKSLPSGITQSWPDDTPMTLQTLATLMISISDNTATDQLIAVLGREAIEAELVASNHANPSLNKPFLSTRELFTLKAGEDGLLDRYAAGDEATRSTILSSIANKHLSDAEAAGIFKNGPRHIDVEWFASPRDIAGIMQRLATLEDHTALEIMAVSPGIQGAERRRWAYLGYKGGSEPGVLNLSWLARASNGDWYVLSMGWNNPDTEVDTGTFELLAQRALALASS